MVTASRLLAAWSTNVNTATSLMFTRATNASRLITWSHSSGRKEEKTITRAGGGCGSILPFDACSIALACTAFAATLSTGRLRP